MQCRKSENFHLPMKCTAIKLTNKKDYRRYVEEMEECENVSFSGEDKHSYSFPNVCKKLCVPKTKLRPKLAITNLNFPKDFDVRPKSSGKWSSKRPRLKSVKIDGKLIPDYDSVDYDIADLVDEANRRSSEDLDDEEDDEEEDELHPDIKELLKKVGQDDDEVKKRRNKSKKTVKNKRAIKFSLSKSPSPETKQIIRIDVVANISADYTGKDDEEVPIEEIMNDTPKSNDDHFVIRCRQLALENRKR